MSEEKIQSTTLDSGKENISVTNLIQEAAKNKIEEKIEKLAAEEAAEEAAEDKLTDEQKSCRNKVRNTEAALNIGSFVFPPARPIVALMKLGRSGLEMMTGKDMCGISIEKVESKKESLKRVAEIGINVVGNATGLGSAAQTAARLGSSYGIDNAFEKKTEATEDVSFSTNTDQVKVNIKSIREKSFENPDLRSGLRLEYK